MPRETYYQDAGNPLQFDRLPATRPLLALPHLALPPLERCGATLLILLLGEAVLVATFYAVYVIEATAAWRHFLFLAIGLTLVVCYIGKVSWRSIGPIAAWVAVVLLLVFAGPPLLRLVWLTVASVSLLAWQFARHWTAICTAAPLDRRAAEQARRSWAWPIALMASAPFVAWGSVQLLGDFVLPALMLAVFVGLQAVVAGDGGPWRRLTVLWEALSSWCTYNQGGVRAPGLLESPAGSWKLRILTMVLPALLVAATTAQFFKSAVPGVEAQLRSHPVAVSTSEQLLPDNTDLSMSGIAGAWLAFNGALLFVAWALPCGLVMPVLLEASRLRREGIQGPQWTSVIHELQHSPDPIERQSYYIGRVVADGSPMLVIRRTYQEHGHFLGDSGGGKTSQGLVPWIEQTVAFGDCSLIVVDLKADSLELLAAMVESAAALRRRTGRQLPLKWFTDQSHLNTFAFNPLTQPYWDNFEPYVKTDILCGAAGLIYGKDYGAGWFTSANAAVLHYAIKNFPDIKTFRELADRIKYTLVSAKKRDLHPELRTAGVHVQEIFDRLSAFDALNVAPHTGHSDEVLHGAIDLADMFRRPQLLYLHLSSVIAAGSAPEIARLFVYSLLCASTQTERRVPVFLVIDEFQRMVAANLEYLLQLARSMGVGVILANQSMQDLKELIPAIEANCRYRQWFSVSSLDDRERLMKAAGVTVEEFVSHSQSSTPQGLTESVTVSEQIHPRWSINDIALASDHPMQSIVTISRGAGYAQYGGLPVIVQSEYHITQAEYERRRAMPWPAATASTFIPREQRRLHDQRSRTRPGPVLTTEIIGELPFGGPPLLPAAPKSRNGNRSRPGGQP